MDRTELSADRLDPAGELVDTGRFGLTDRLPTSDNFYAVLIKS